VFIGTISVLSIYCLNYMVILKCNSLKIQIYKKMSLSTLTYYGFEIEYRNRLNHRVSGFFQRHPIGRIPEHKKKPDRLYRQSGSKSKFTENYFTETTTS